MRQDDAPPLVIRGVRLEAGAQSMAGLSRLYADTLRLPARSAADGLTLSVGPSEVEFTAAPDDRRPFYHYALLVPGDRFAAAMDWLTGCGVTLLPVPGTTETVFEFGAWDAQACYFEDPAGNIVELIAHRGRDENGAAGRFSPEELTGVSEIGLVVEDLPRAAEALGTGLGLPVWDGSVAGDLAFVGSQAHTLILTSTARCWLPTRRRAEIHPLEVTVDGRGSGELTLPDLPYRLIGR
jgi:catechol-2,3-dioxygenase